jgi:hypothetical protein
MDQHHILLIILLLVSEVCGAIPEEYIRVNGFMDLVCKILKEMLKKPDTCHAETELSAVESSS